MKNRMAVITLALTCAVLVATSCASQKTVTEQEKFTVSTGNIVQSVSADGALSLPLDRKLSFGTSGTIEQMNVEEGDKVAKGKVLARLETASLERAVKTAELAISAAEADVKQAELGIKTAEADLKQAEDNVKSAGIDLDMATDGLRKLTYPFTYSTFALDIPTALSRISGALGQIEEAQKNLQAAMTVDQYNQAARQLRDAKDNLVIARQSLARGSGQDPFISGEFAGGASASGLLGAKDFWTVRAAQLQAEKSQMAVENAKTLLSKSQVAVDNARIISSKTRLAVDRARHELETTQDLLDKAVITAPFDGIVARVDFKEGDSFTTVDFTRTVVHVIDPRRMELTVDVDEIDIPSVKDAQEAVLSFDAMPGVKLSGKVVFISPLSKVEGGVVLYEVKLSLDVPETLGLRAGMSATANIVTARRENVLTLPSRTISQDASGKATVKLLVSGKAEERTVVTGISDSFNTEIVSGLSEGDTVVIERQVKSGAAGIFG